LGSNLKKIRSLNLNTKILFLGILLSSGFLGTFLLNNQNQVVYKFFSSDVLGYSSNMREPLGFLSDLIKE